MQARAEVEREISASLAKTFDPQVYRRHTEGLLRRYMQMSLQVARTPSCMGREVFRSGASSHTRAYSFEDVVIFVCDVEKCVATLDEMGQRMVNRIGMQDYAVAEVAQMVGASERSVVRWYQEALDALTVLLIDRGLMKPFVL